MSLSNHILIADLTVDTSPGYPSTSCRVDRVLAAVCSLQAIIHGQIPSTPLLRRPPLGLVQTPKRNAPASPHELLCNWFEKQVYLFCFKIHSVPVEREYLGAIESEI